MTADDAVAEAKRLIGKRLNVAGDSEPGYWMRGGQLEPAYRVYARVFDENGHSIPHRLVTSAISGDVLEDLRLVTDRCYAEAAEQRSGTQTDHIRESLADLQLGFSIGQADQVPQESASPLIGSSAEIHVSALLPLENDMTAVDGSSMVDRRILAADYEQAATGESILVGDNNGAGWAIPDEAYLQVGGAISDGPGDAVVTRITYSLQVSPDIRGHSFFAGDYEIFITTERLLQQDQGLRVYATGDRATDGGLDDDVEDDRDILLWNRSTDGLNNESAAEPFYVLVFDRSGGDVGNLNFVELRISWASGTGGGGAIGSSEGVTNIFDPNPVTTTGEDTPGFPDLAYVQVSFDDMLETPENGAYVLNGPYCQILDIEAPSQPAPASASTEFGFPADASCFAANMCFYHIGMSIVRLRSLGFDSAFASGLRSDHRGVGMEVNAHYAGDPVGAGYVAFGMGANNRPIAEDADVILHEFGHALQDNQNPGAFFQRKGRDGLEPGAITEGFGDYWTFSMTYDANMNGPLRDPDRLAEWAFPGGLRRTDGNKVFPLDWAGEVHDDGEIWSAALVEIFRAIERDAADQIIVTSNFLVPSSGPTFRDASLALLAAESQLFGGIHSATICEILTSRGLFDGARETKPGPPEDDRFEDHDPAAQAEQIGEGALRDLIAKDEDWYRVDLQRAASVSAQTTGSGGDLDLYIFDGDLALVDASERNGIDENVGGDLPFGSCYMAVVPLEPGATYELRVEVVATEVCIAPGPCGSGCAAALGMSTLGLVSFSGCRRRRVAR